MNKVNIYSMSWESAVVSITLEKVSFVNVKLTSQEGERILKSVEANRVTRMTLDGLSGGTSYLCEVTWEGGSEEVAFTTLPAPVGDLLSSFAVIADPHISVKNENRKGRLFRESSMILSDIIVECNSLNVEFGMIAGDITNHCEEEEFQIASGILEQADFPLVCAPGDHDVSDGGALWRKYCEKYFRLHESERFSVVPIVTAYRDLRDRDMDMLSETLEHGRKPVVLVTHRHLYPNNDFKYGTNDERVNNIDEYIVPVDSGRRGSVILIYAGHQNIPTRVEHGGTWQISVPQTCQYLCGWYYVREYENGFYHTFMPIRSDILQEESRISGDQAGDLYEQPRWKAEYRAGKSIYDRNFICGWEKSSVLNKMNLKQSKRSWE